MIYPYLQPTAKRHDITQEFRGLNLAPKTRRGEFSVLENISLRKYPNMTVRKRRGTVAKLTNGHTLGGNSTELAWIDSGFLYYKGEKIEGLPELHEAPNTQITAFGSYIIVTPDNVYYNTIDPADKGSISVSNESTGQVQYILSRRDGVDYSTENMTVSDNPPDEPNNGDYWINTSEETSVLMQFSSFSGTWAQIPTVYTKIKATGIGKGLREFDAVNISGVTADTATDGQLKKELQELNGSKIIYGVSDDYIIVIGLLKSVYTQTTGTVKVSRDVPIMDYVCVSQNRLWGCRYGSQKNSDKIVNEIYASKLGDFKNFNVFMGVSTDSYVAGVGQDGEFTGAVNHLGYPIFFKENCLYKLYGDQPKNFRISDTVCAGVKKGAYKSIAIVNETLFYLSRNGEFVAYDGALPSSVSAAFADNTFDSAVSGQYINQYVVSAKMTGDADEKIYILDTKRMLWTCEDTGKTHAFYTADGEIYMLREEMDGSFTIYALNGAKGTMDETIIRWRAETGMIGWESPEQKYAQRFNIRIRTGKPIIDNNNAPVVQDIALDIEYDSNGIWEHQATEGFLNARRGTIMLPVRPRRCDHFRIKLSGQSNMEIYSIDFLASTGGDGRGRI